MSFAHTVFLPGEVARSIRQIVDRLANGRAPRIVIYRTLGDGTRENSEVKHDSADLQRVCDFSRDDTRVRVFLGSGFVDPVFEISCYESDLEVVVEAPSVQQLRDTFAAVQSALGLTEKAPGKASPKAPVTADRDTDVWRLMHKRIIDVAKERFESKHYADAAEAAFKAVSMRVKALWIASGNEEKDGKALMLSALSPNQPTIRLADLSTLSGRDTQEGYMHLFAGSIQAIRNPKAHELITISPERALHFLMLASLLMSKLDEAGAA